LNKTKKNKFFVTSLMYLYSNSGASAWASLELHTQDNLVNYPFEKIWLWRYRTSVRILRVEISRNEFLPSPIVSKGFRNDWQIRVYLQSKCVVDFSGRQFDVWGEHRWFQRKVSCRLISRGKLARIHLGKIVSCTKKKSLMKYIMLKKNLTPLYVWEKICNSKLNHLYPPPPQKSNGQPH